MSKTSATRRISQACNFVACVFIVFPMLSVTLLNGASMSGLLLSLVPFFGGLNFGVFFACCFLHVIGRWPPLKIDVVVTSLLGYMSGVTFTWVQVPLLDPMRADNFVEGLLAVAPFFIVAYVFAIPLALVSALFAFPEREGSEHPEE